VQGEARVEKLLSLMSMPLNKLQEHYAETFKRLNPTEVRSASLSYFGGRPGAIGIMQYASLSG